MIMDASTLPPKRTVGGHLWEGRFFGGSVQASLHNDILKSGFGVHQIIYGSLLSSWPTSQPVNDFPNIIAIFWKLLTSNSQTMFISKQKVVRIFFFYPTKNHTHTHTHVEMISILIPKHETTIAHKKQCS